MHVYVYEEKWNIIKIKHDTATKAYETLEYQFK